MQLQKREEKEIMCQQKTENIMGVRPVFPLLMAMAVPPMVSMMIQSMYNIVDSIFVARISQDALTAVSLAFPLQNLSVAVAVGLGVGINSCIARGMGAKNTEEVNSTASHGLILAFIHSLLFVMIGLFLSKPFIRMFTDNEEICKMGSQYSNLVMCFSFGVMFHICIEKMFQSVGSMVIPMILQGVGAVVNIILDPILIFGLWGFPAMGVRGAAIATIIGQLLACTLSILMFYCRNGGIHVSLKKFQWNTSIVKKIYIVAVPSAIMMSLPSILIGILNGILVNISQASVAVLGLYFKLQTFVYMPSNGVVQGMRPIVSFNYGAGYEKRLRDTLKVSLFTVGVIMAFGTGLFLFLPKQIMLLFHADAELMEIGVSALRIISVGFIISTVGVIFSGAFEALGKGIQSLTISLLRQLVIIPPLALLLVGPMGLNGVWATFPAAEAIAAVVAVFIYKRTGISGHKS